MVYAYIGKGTSLLNMYGDSKVENLKPGTIVLGLYIGPGDKKITVSRVKSVRGVGKAKCKMFGSLADYALIVKGQKTIDPNFRFIEIDNVLYSIGRIVPRPIKVYQEVETEIYEVELEDSDVAPLLSSYCFIAFTDKPIKLKGGSNGQEESKSTKQTKQKQKPKKGRKQKPKEIEHNTDNSVTETRGDDNIEN